MFISCITRIEAPSPEGLRDQILFSLHHLSAEEVKAREVPFRHPERLGRLEAFYSTIPTGGDGVAYRLCETDTLLDGDQFDSVGSAIRALYATRFPNRKVVTIEGCKTFRQLVGALKGLIAAGAPSMVWGFDYDRVETGLIEVDDPRGLDELQLIALRGAKSMVSPLDPYSL